MARRDGSPRKHPRFRASFDTLYGEREGVGSITDISYEGAFIEGATHLPEIGSEVRLYVFVAPVSPFEIVGTVVRHEKSGFAIAYTKDDPEVRRLVEDVAAIVAT